MTHADDQTEQQLEELLQTVSEYYAVRGIFQDRFGFGAKPAIVVVDFAYGWTDDAYAGGSARLDAPVENTRTLLNAGREAHVPIAYTTSPWRTHGGDMPFKSAADLSPGYRAWDQRACEIDRRVLPQSEDLIIEKENASAFFGTHLAPWLIQHQVDTLLITGCSTSACIRATATDARSYRFRPMIIRDCVGDRSAVCHQFTLHDIQARFADVVSLDETLAWLAKLSE